MAQTYAMRTLRFERQRISWLVTSLTACAAVAPHENGREPYAEDPFAPRVELVFLREGECPNWEPALNLAWERACCGEERSGERRSGQCECTKRFACDVCQFLAEGKPPSAFITNLPGGQLFAEGASMIERPFPPGASPVAWVELKRSRCYGPGYGFWIFREDNVQLLAEAMIHEALHQCQTVGGHGPLVHDPDTERVAHSCFE
jgi:hypothetical protein